MVELIPGENQEKYFKRNKETTHDLDRINTKLNIILIIQNKIQRMGGQNLSPQNNSLGSVREYDSVVTKYFHLDHEFKTKSCKFGDGRLQVKSKFF